MAPLPALAVALVHLFGDAVVARPEPLDRVVAVVGEEPLFLSELRARARIHLLRAGAADEKARAAIVRDVLEQLVIERIEAREAAKAHVEVSTEEVDRALELVAGQQKISVAELLTEAQKQGLSKAEYRDLLAKQILEGKLLQLQVRSQIKVTEADARAVYAAWLKEQTNPAAAGSFDTMKEQMMTRAFAEASEREERKWRAELRRTHYVEVLP